MPARKGSEAAVAARHPITIRGARVHNLKGIDVEIPSEKLVVITGVSGSGKSSLAFDTLYAEGQRRYVESLSAYARQFLERMEKPAVEAIDGVCPAVAIQQKVPPRSSRSTVATTTEIHDYLRLLFARVGVTICPSCGAEVRADAPGAAVDGLIATAPLARVVVTFPVTLARTLKERKETLLGLLQQGFRRVWRDGEVIEVSARKLDDCATRVGYGSVDIVVDRAKLDPEARDRLVDSMEIAFNEGGGRASAFVLAGEGAGVDAREAIADEHAFDRRFRCADCDRDFVKPEPRLFSFNNPYGACPECKGFGNIIEVDLDKVVPDKTVCLADGAIEPWDKASRGRWRKRLADFCAAQEIPMEVPWQELEAGQRRAVLEGGDGFPGVLGFFDRLKKKNYKLHVRVLLARYRGYVPCPACAGSRLRDAARNVHVGGLTLGQVTAMSIDRAEEFFRELELPAADRAVAERLVGEVRSRLAYLVEVGVGYLTLDRLTGTLSGGEAQRINLATCLGSALVGAMYVLDEPSIGLHPRDNERLIGILRRLRDLGNSVIVVEHDRDMIEVADHVIDLGPGAGAHGGELVFAGTPAELAGAEGLTAEYVRGDKQVAQPPRVRPAEGRLRIVGAREHNLKNIEVEIPLGVLCCVTGVSGSGKSTLIHDVLHGGLRQRMGPWKDRVGEHDRIEGAELVDRVVLVDQSAIGRSSRSNPVTYIKAFDGIRSAFAATREAKARGYAPGHFSFNVAGGRCEACEGSGEVVVEMQFLPDVSLPCEECEGSRYRADTLEIEYRGKNIQEVLELTVSEGRRFLADITATAKRLQVLEDVGLGYLRLGQPSTTLSGGEAQRVKLAAHLIEGAGSNTLYLFDEPTTGLHFDDISKLLFALNRLVDAGASVVVIEHNLEFLKTADWIIDLGPEGGDDGGWVVAEGTPEEVAGVPLSYTGAYLEKALERT
jgi:excinuclease ABC subunit A